MAIVRPPRIRRIFALPIAAILVAIGFSPLVALDEQPEIKVGYLQCDVSDGWGYLVGSARYLECNFTPTGGESEQYHGELAKFGADIGYIHSGRILWAVLAPSNRLGEGGLSGHYAGVSLGAAVGVGAGMNVLVGGLRSTITLQPVSIEGDLGLDISLGAAYLTLEPGYP